MISNVRRTYPMLFSGVSGVSGSLLCAMWDSFFVSGVAICLLIRTVG